MCLLSCAAEKTACGRSRGSQVGCTHAHQRPVAACCSYRWQCGKLVPFLVSKPDGLVPPCRRPVRAIAAPHTATQVMWESRGLRPAVTYHILPLPFGSVCGQDEPGGEWKDLLQESKQCPLLLVGLTAPCRPWTGTEMVAVCFSALSWQEASDTGRGALKAVNRVLLEMFMPALVVGPRVACAANSVCLHLPEDFFIMDMNSEHSLTK